MPQLKITAVTVFLFLAMPAFGQQKCTTLDCINNQRSLAADDLAFVRKHHDWLADQVDENFLQQLAKETATLDINRDNPIPLAFALAKEGSAALLLDRKRLAVDRLNRAANLLQKHSPRDASKRMEIQVLLAIAHSLSENFDEAANATSRAQQVVHLVHGANSPIQLPLMYRKAAYLNWEGKDWPAEQQYRGALRLAEKAYGSTSDQAVEANHRLATHLLSLYAFRPAWTVYREALKSVEEADGGYHYNAVPLMVGQAHAHLRARFSTRAFRYFRKALATMAQHPNHYSVRDRVEMHHHFGQILMALYEENSAIEHFQSAWQLANEHHLADWLERFEQPELIPNSRFRVVDSDDGVSGLSLSYRLSDTGRPRRVKPDDNIDDFKVARYAQALLRLARIRPPIIDGEPVGLSDQKISIEFQSHYPDAPNVVQYSSKASDSSRRTVNRQKRPAYNGRPIQRSGGEKSVG